MFFGNVDSDPGRVIEAKFIVAKAVPRRHVAIRRQTNDNDRTIALQFTVKINARILRTNLEYFEAAWVW